MTKTLPFLTKTYDKIYAISSFHGKLKTLKFCSALGISPKWETDPFVADFNEKEKTLFIISSNFIPIGKVHDIMLRFLLFNDFYIKNGNLDLYFIEQEKFIDSTTSIFKLNELIVETVRRAYYEIYDVNPWSGYGPYFLYSMPYGYKFANAWGILDWVPDDKYKYPIQVLFKTFSSQKQTRLELATLMRMYGLELTPYRIDRILRNPFYAGYFEFDDQFYPHAHEPIIDKKLYNAVQKKLKNGNPII